MDFNNDYIDRVIKEEIYNVFLTEGFMDRLKSVRTGYEMGSNELNQNSQYNQIMTNLVKWRGKVKKYNYNINFIINNINEKLDNNDLQPFFNLIKEIGMSLYFIYNLMDSKHMNQRKLDESLGDKLKGAWQGFNQNIDVKQQKRNGNFRKRYTNDIEKIKSELGKIQKNIEIANKQKLQVKKIARKIPYGIKNKKRISLWSPLSSVFKYLVGLNNLCSDIISITQSSSNSNNSFNLNDKFRKGFDYVDNLVNGTDDISQTKPNSNNNYEDDDNISFGTKRNIVKNHPKLTNLYHKISPTLNNWGEKLDKFMSEDE